MEAPEDQDQPVFILLGKVWTEENTPPIAVHILLKAADDDSAIREALNALSEDGYAEASFDQIGTLVDQPDEEPHASAYQGAMEGEVAIVAYDEMPEGSDASPARNRLIDDDEEINPFDVLADWGKEK
jgi:hypothetical protein